MLFTASKQPLDPRTTNFFTTLHTVAPNFTVITEPQINFANFSDKEIKQLREYYSYLHLNKKEQRNHYREDTKMV